MIARVPEVRQTPTLALASKEQQQMGEARGGLKSAAKTASTAGDQLLFRLFAISAPVCSRASATAVLREPRPASWIL
jgi:hypothetical protein